MPLNTTPDPCKEIDLIGHPTLPGLAALVTFDKHGAGTWKGISKADAAILATKLREYSES